MTLLTSSPLKNSKKITQDVRDRAKVLDVLLMKSTDSEEIDKKILAVDDKIKETEKKIGSARDKSGRMMKGFNPTIEKGLKNDKKALTTEKQKLLMEFF